MVGWCVNKPNDHNGNNETQVFFYAMTDPFCFRDGKEIVNKKFIYIYIYIYIYINLFIIYIHVRNSCSLLTYTVIYINIYMIGYC